MSREGTIKAVENLLGKDPGSLRVQVGRNTLAEVERAVIEATLAHFEGHRERTAFVLGISLKTLYNRLQEYREADQRQGVEVLLRTSKEAGGLLAQG